ncbi:hypothetical protein [Granulicella aggregans]|uniref:hypothetical protein n=1 Tax=Granulicella aggregans TaxID=474949 RepID=UPI0021E0B795|nr:hypothetical protein [Granulicella aggregans]
MDRAGGIHGLARRIEGARVRDVRERLADLDANDLPDVPAVRRQLQKHQAQEQGREAAEIVGTVERLRLEELGREADARLVGGARLNSSDHEAADAIWQLNRTMRGQMDAVIASTRQPLELRPRDPDNADRPDTEPPRSLERPEIGQGPPARDEAQVEPGRPSAVLFVRVFGWLVEHYQRALDRRAADMQLEPIPAPAVPAQPDKPKSLFEAARKRLAARSPEQVERDRAAQRLREIEERQRKRPEDREYS